jgi:hypothetical protein
MSHMGRKNAGDTSLFAFGALEDRTRHSGSRTGRRSGCRSVGGRKHRRFMPVEAQRARDSSWYRQADVRLVVVEIFESSQRTGLKQKTAEVGKIEAMDQEAAQGMKISLRR